jgi:uncharacterized protein YciI
MIWKAAGTGREADEAFQSRIPRLMAWLKDMKAGGHLAACGGGAFEDLSGGLTVIRAHSAAEAREWSAKSPMNEIGNTEIMIWDLFHADLAANREWGR